MKPKDEGNTVPLCGGDSGHHQELHQHGQRTFEQKYGIDLAAVAAQLTEIPPEDLL